MSQRWQDRVFKCTRTIMKHFVDQDLAKMVPEIYEEEFEAVVDFVAAAIIECICIGFEDFNVDVVRGIIYCAVSQVSSGVFPPPDIKDCMINPDSVKNEMVYSESLIELQELIREKRREYAGYLGNTEFIILAVSAEVFEKLQTSLDRTIATVLENARHTTETFMKNSNLVPENSLIFQRFYYGALYQLMVMSDTIIGSALDEKSQILDDISKVKYEDQEIFGDEDEEEEFVIEERDYPVDDIGEDDDDGGCRCPFRYGCRD